MSGAIMNKIWGAFGMDANEEEEEYEDESRWDDDVDYEDFDKYYD